MKLVVQRVEYARVSVGGSVVGECQKGLMLLLGVAEGDTREDADALAKKLTGLRIFTDENDKMNLSIKDIGGEALVVSNFTLLANYRKGNRPDYMNAASPSEADRLYRYFTELMRGEVKHVGTGEFGADMKVSLLNDGPVTIVMDSQVLKK